MPKRIAALTDMKYIRLLASIILPRSAVELIAHFADEIGSKSVEHLKSDLGGHRQGPKGVNVDARGNWRGTGTSEGCLHSLM